MRILIGTLALLFVVNAGAEGPPSQSNGAPSLKATPEAWLAANLKRFHETYDVYSDASAAGNHFAVRGRMYGRSGPSDQCSEAQATRCVPAMDEDVHCPGRVGTCIRATFRPAGNDWGGWSFMNGMFPGAEPPQPPETADGKKRGPSPGVNWGTVPDAWVDLTGATELTFWAKGERGGEKVDFFVFGIGYDEFGRPLADAPYRENAARTPPMSMGVVTLTRDWRQYKMTLRGQTINRVLGGFAWTASAANNRSREVVFYLDDIRYDLPRPSVARFPLSYEVVLTKDPLDFDSVTRNTSFTYDAAVALVAFIAVGDWPNATLIADALVYAQSHDRTYDDGRIRNAYQAGDLFLPPGWIAERRDWPIEKRQRTVRLPGWYVPVDLPAKKIDAGWYEDEFHVSTHTGNVAWYMLSLIGYWEATVDQLTEAQRQPYLDAVIKAATWLDSDQGCGCRDSRGGYTGGHNSWEGQTQKIGYRATEHNIDLVAAFERLSKADIERSDKWAADADHARSFVESMWQEVPFTDQKEHPQKYAYLTGTGPDGTGVNANVIPVDIQAWAVLALGSRAHQEALDFADAELSSGVGYAFGSADRKETWYEGTAHMAVAFHEVGRQGRADALKKLLDDARHDSGVIDAASGTLFTGFDSTPGQKWFYYKRPHLGATAWAVLAQRGVNPFAPVRSR